MKKKLCCGRNLLCFVSLYVSWSCLVLVAYNKTNIPCLFFCIISKLFSLDNVAFNSASRCWILISSGWIISDIKQKSALHKICQNTGFYWRVFSHINFYSPRNYQKSYDFLIVEPFQDGGRYHIETSPLICRANQWTGFYMITASVLKELRGSEVNTGEYGSVKIRIHAYFIQWLWSMKYVVKFENL